MLLAWISRRTRHIGGWVILLAVLVPLLVSSWRSSTPRARVERALDVSLPQIIARVLQYDSFNDGFTLWGQCSATPQFVESLIAKHQLTFSTTPGILHPS